MMEYNKNKKIIRLKAVLLFGAVREENGSMMILSQVYLNGYLSKLLRTNL